MTKNPHFHGCVKHIDTRHHFICEQVLNRKINLEYCPTEDMTADILTKGLNRELFVKHCKNCGLTQIFK